MNPLTYPSGRRRQDPTASRRPRETSPRQPQDMGTVGGVSSNTADWLLEISDLTVGRSGDPTSDIIRQSKALAHQVRTAATAYVASNHCEDHNCHQDCALAGIDGGPAACRLAGALAFATNGMAPSEGCAATYLQAVRAAAPAVFHCRRHAHPTGECWFANDATDACGDVLAVSHRVAA